MRRWLPSDGADHIDRSLVVTAPEQRGAAQEDNPAEHGRPG
jgi:hypothetical protein